MSNEAKAPKGAGKKTFFLNRWITKLSNWFDSSVFNIVEKEGYYESSPLCVRSLWVGILAGIVIAIVVMINEQSSIPNWTMGIAGAIIVAMIVMQAIKDLKLLSTTGQKVGRLAYLILVPFTFALLGAIIAAIAVWVVVFILILWLFFTLIFGTNKKVKLSNNDVVRDNGVFGYRGESGDTYTKNLDGTYTKDN